MEIALELLRRNSCRITRARRAVLAGVFAGPAHITAEQVLRLGRRSHPGLSRSSVYRALQLLVSLGVLRAMPSPQGRRFVLIGEGHHHLICQACGSVSDFPRCGLCNSLPEAAHERRFQVAGHLVEVFGLCDSCRREE